MPEPINKIHRDHNLNIFISYQLKERIMQLAEKYDRTMADTVRTLLKVAIPVMEGLTEADENILKHTISSIQKMKKAQQMRIENEGYKGNDLKTET
jgi:predicted DNA-binding protein